MARLAASHYCFFPQWRAGELGAPAFVSRCRELGLDGAELLVPWTTAKDVAAIRADGLPIASVSATNNFSRPPAEFEAEVGKILRAIEWAVELGAPTVRVFAGDVAEGQAREDIVQRATRGLSRAAREAEGAGVVLALENHGQLAGRSNQVKSFLECVGSPAFRACVDVGNFVLVDEDPAAAVAELARWAGHVHLKDFRLDEEGPFASLEGLRYAGTVVGEGSVPLSACLTALRDAGYDSWFSLEYEGAEPPSTAVPRSIAAARRRLADG